ncbi:MAG: DUF4831 family protein [Paludibacteraceae bacterium]|nr:DUF4831 family protein [Paludibacteraceae bacterium]
MKKTFALLVAALTLTTALQAQTLQAGEPAVVYYSPKTNIILDFSYTEEIHRQGVYAGYAEELLGIDDVVSENKTTYTIQGVQINTRTEADLSRPHKIVAEPGVPVQYITLNEKNILVGYNLPAVNEKKNTHNNKRTADGEAGVVPVRVFPFGEEVTEAKSIAAEAQAVAKQIYRIRESRMYLLSGEVEHAPADGNAMKLVLEELNNQEKQLTELFTGTISRTTKHKRISYLPMAEDGKNFHKKLYFSADHGFTTSENAEAEEIGVTIQHTRPQVTPAQDDAKNKKKGNEPSQIVYNLPGQGQVMVRYKGETLAERTLPLAQFGIDVPLAKDLFTGKTLPVIRFNETTGNIVSISK